MLSTKTHHKEQAEYLIKRFNLNKHVEGGYFSEYYRSKNHLTVSNDGSEERRNYSTSIYFLLEGEDISSWHKLKSDEIWHFHDGCALTINILSKENKDTLTQVKLGNPLEDESNQPSVVIEANQWFSASINNKDSFSFLSCTVSPGFDFKDFSLAKKESLLEEFPSYKDIIQKYTK